VLRPVISVADASEVEAAAKARHDAHGACLVGRSVVARVAVEPRIEVAPS
jgi:hypothetical protein